MAYDRRTFLIKGEWVHVPNCVDDTPRAEVDESKNNPWRKNSKYAEYKDLLWWNFLLRLSQRRI